ncbi:thiamine kinase-like enzyme [Paenibacillus shirakamiensis]|uniref:Thiamine kinase-like enzyme n=1 Tax=Paenibacillus shirakamiensis TaxID=1265935 RepID=A0ABS4JIL0_9BACL|nr:phosphotransferase [Paenibacillus shirakamiensis]MBP2001544.1 thiamine kinase-like enzyme [Paenibacillus shirakamiensis]
MYPLTKLNDSHRHFPGLPMLKREVLYTGMNGQQVERIYSTLDKSYIYKPLTNDSQSGRERWIYHHILPLLPDIYPALVDASFEKEGPDSWLLFEDLGPLRHVFRMDTAREVLKHMARWHTFPHHHWPDGLTLQGPKPSILQMAAELCARAEDLYRVTAWAIPEEAENIVQFIRAVDVDETFFRDAVVLTHGDLHLGNYSKVRGRTMILDWEHAHLNLPYWDLYHVLDVSHPLYPRRITPSQRTTLLHYYMHQSAQYGEKLDKEIFMRNYRVFSCVFSLWMLLLVESDLSSGQTPWPQDKLLVQREEIKDSLRHNIRRWR